MTVPAPTFGPNGFVVPAESEILDALLTDINVALGGNVNPGLTTPQGQLAMSVAAIAGDANATFLWYATQVDPAFNSGRMQDAIGRIYFIQRIPGSPTVVTATCSGLTGTIIPVGALARAEDGNLYVCQAQGVIPAAGYVDLPFACAVDGPVPCPADSLDFIYQTIAGWDSVTNSAAGILGRDVESAAEFEERRRLSTAINSTGHLPAILGAVLQVDGVLDAYVTENDQPSPVAIGGVTLNANSIYVCVLGGLATDIAQAIWSRKAPGCGYTGNTSVVVTDPSPSYTVAPTYAVLFEVPEIVEYVVLVTLKNSLSVPSTAQTLVANAVIAAFAGLDGGSRAKIGSTVYASRYYGPVAALGSWAQQIEQIQIGRIGSGAEIVGSIAGNVLTVTSVIEGVLATGQVLTGSLGDIEGGTIITGFVSGSVGGTGTYTVSQTQTIPSENIWATELEDSDQLNINEAPTTSTALVLINLI